jgi:predicted DNA-binding transcriptional regulator AlpA
MRIAPTSRKLNLLSYAGVQQAVPGSIDNDASFPMYPTKPTKQSLPEYPRLTPIAKPDLERATGVADRFLRQRQVLPLSGFGSLSTLKIKIKNGEFPSPIRISEGRQAWSEREVIEWQRKKIAERDAILAKKAST